jgi:hypothetical protein
MVVRQGRQDCQAKLSAAAERSSRWQSETVDGQVSAVVANVEGTGRIDDAWRPGIALVGDGAQPYGYHIYGAYGHNGRRAMVVMPSLQLVASWNDTSINSVPSLNETLRRLASAAQTTASAGENDVAPDAAGFTIFLPFVEQAEIDAAQPAMSANLANTQLFLSFVQR